MINLAPPPQANGKKSGTVVPISDKNIAKAAKQATHDDKVYYVDNDNTIRATTWYKADDGDIVLIANTGGRTIVTVINESMLEDRSDDVPHITQRQPRIKQLLDTKTGNTIELCEISLGHFRNKLSKVDNILTIIAGVRKYYDKTTGEELENDKSGNVEYKTRIICDASKREQAIEILNKFFKANEKVIAEWFTEH